MDEVTSRDQDELDNPPLVHSNAWSELESLLFTKESIKIAVHIFIGLLRRSYSHRLQSSLVCGVGATVLRLTKRVSPLGERFTS